MIASQMLVPELAMVASSGESGQNTDFRDSLPAMAIHGLG